MYFVTDRQLLDELSQVVNRILQLNTHNKYLPDLQYCFLNCLHLIIFLQISQSNKGQQDNSCSPVLLPYSIHHNTGRSITIEFNEARKTDPCRPLGKRGRGTDKNQVLVTLSKNNKGYPLYLKMEVIEDMKKETVVDFVTKCVEINARIQADGHRSFPSLETKGYKLEAASFFLPRRKLVAIGLFRILNSR
jgi:hypothetical protein